MGCEPSSSSLSTLKRPETKTLEDAPNCRVNRKKRQQGVEKALEILDLDLSSVTWASLVAQLIKNRLQCRRPQFDY